MMMSDCADDDGDDDEDDALLRKDEDFNADAFGGCPNPAVRRPVARQLGNLDCFSSVTAGEKL